MSHEILDHIDGPAAKVIAQAPVLVFLLVSAADGTIDKHEIRRFELLLSDTSYSDMKAVIQRTGLSIVDTLRQLAENHVDYLAELQRVARVLDTQLPATSARQIKNQLYDLGCSIAASSADGQADTEDTVSTQEQVALKVIAGLIGVDEGRY